MKPARFSFMMALTATILVGCTSSVKSVRISNANDAQRIGGLVYALPKSRIRLETSLEFVGCACDDSAYQEPDRASAQTSDEAAKSLATREANYVSQCKNAAAVYNIKQLKLDLKPLPDPDAMYVLDVTDAKQLTQTLDKLNIVLKEGLVESVDYTAEDHTANAIVETVRLKTALDGFASAAPSGSSEAESGTGTAASAPAGGAASQAGPVAINIYTAQPTPDANTTTTAINEAGGILPDVYRSGKKFRQVCGAQLAKLDFRHKEALHTLKGYYDDRDAMYAKIYDSLDQPAAAAVIPNKSQKQGKKPAEGGGDNAGEGGSNAAGKIETIGKALKLWDDRVDDAHKFIARTRKQMTFQRAIEWPIDGEHDCEPLINELSGVYACVEVKTPHGKESDETESSEEYEETGMYYRVPLISTVDVSLTVRVDSRDDDRLTPFHITRFHNRAIYNEGSVLARIPMTNGPFSRTEASFGFDENGMINKYNYSSPKAPYNEAVKAAADAISTRIVAKTPPEDASTSSDDGASSDSNGNSSDDSGS